MKQIEFERWEPDAENPCKLKYAGQRKAEDVFHELEARLDSVGYENGQISSFSRM